MHRGEWRATGSGPSAASLLRVILPKGLSWTAAEVPLLLYPLQQPTVGEADELFRLQKTTAELFIELLGRRRGNRLLHAFAFGFELGEPLENGLERGDVSLQRLLR